MLNINKIIPFTLFFFFISGIFISTFSYASSSELVEDSWNTKTPMSQQQKGVSFAVLDGKIYAIGCEATAFYDLVGSTERYDPATDTWTTLEPMPTPRDSANVVVYQGKIYCIGGSTVASGPGLYRNLNTVEIYDSVTDSWSSRASVPVNATHFWSEEYYPDMKAVVVNEQLFVIISSGALYMYNPSANSWSSRASLPVENLYSSVYVVNEQLFGISQNEMYMYNPFTDSWTKKTTPPPPDTYISYQFITVTDGRIIIGDQQKTDSSTDSVRLNLRIYDPKTDVWSERKTNSNSVIFYGGSMFVGATSGAYAPKKLYIFSYEQVGKDSFQAFTWTYDLASDVWSTAKPITAFRNVLGSKLIVANDVFYIIGGNTVNDQYVPVGYNPQGYPNTSPSATAPSTIFPTASDSTSSPTPSGPESSRSFLTRSIAIAATVLTVCVVVTSVLFFYLRKKRKQEGYI
jgi:N-acetylneuraminic acid mutarotase